MERVEWLKNLKSGDKVANKTKTGWDNQTCYRFYEIKNITAKGNIRLTNGILLNANGEYHKYENWNSTDYYIEPITDEILKFEKDRREYNNLRREVRELFDNFGKKEYSIEILKELKEILSK